MASPTSSNNTSNSLVVLGVVLLMLGHVQQKAYASNFKKNFHSTWGHNRVQILNNHRLLTLSLDEISGSGFQSKSQYLFGKFDMKLKLVAGDSAGTVTTFYLASNGRYHDEIDFEFLGNVSGQPYTVHTNVFSQGKGDREQQFRLWFDPTQDFHTYSITWSPHSIIFSVDGKPIREFKNMESRGVPYPKKKPMKIYASLWSAEWATMGGLVKTDWTKAPFVASYGDFRIRACKWVHSRGYSCPPNFINSNTTSRDRDHQWMNHGLDYMSKKRLKMVQSNYKIYDYCTDKDRFPKGFPPECSN